MIRDYKFGEKFTSSIEELKLENMDWEFVTRLLAKIEFPCLKSLSLNLYDDLLDIYEILSELQQLTELRSLEFLSYQVWNFGKERSFKFDKLKLFKFDKLKLFKFDKLTLFKFYPSKDKIKLNRLLAGMPNLIELIITGRKTPKLYLKKPAASLRYLHVPKSLNESQRGIYVNFLKNTPNLVQLRNSRTNYLIVEDGISAGDLAYYLKMLKEYFNDGFSFKIDCNCFPIQLLEMDTKLQQLVRRKSSLLIDYLQENFPLDAWIKNVEKIFTVDADLISSIKSVSQLTRDLIIKNADDATFVDNILGIDGNGKPSESSLNSLKKFYVMFAKYLEREIGIKFQDVHLNFIKQFMRKNSQQSLFKLFIFLKGFFVSISRTYRNPQGQTKLINAELFKLFYTPILSNSLNYLIDQIRDAKLEPEAKVLLNSLFSFDCDSVSAQLRILDKKFYEELRARLDQSLFKFDGVSNPFSNFVFTLNLLLKDMECPICLERYFPKKCIFFKRNDGTECHLFHKKCLDKWAKVNKNCPICRQKGN